MVSVVVWCGADAAADAGCREKVLRRNEANKGIINATQVGTDSLYAGDLQQFNPANRNLSQDGSRNNC